MLYPIDGFFLFKLEKSTSEENESVHMQGGRERERERMRLVTSNHNVGPSSCDKK
jgi:hypothetical protein